MATQFSMIAIMNAALTAQGQDIIAENDGSNEFNVLSRNWPLIVEAELEDGLYNFGRQQAFLQTRTDGKFGWPDGYLVPGDAIHVRQVWVEDGSGVREFIDWSQDGTYVYVCRADGVFIEYVAVADADLWSANFSRGVQMKLEALILRAIKEEAGEAGQMEQQAEIYFQRARTASSKSRSPTKPFRSSRFADARFRRG